MLEEYPQQFTQSAHTDLVVIKQMREFYYQRMMTTANFLIGVCTVFVAIIALIVSAVALLK